MKRCLICNSVIRSKDWRRAKFCKRACYAESLRHSQPSKAAARKRAQKAVRLTECGRCGSTEKLQRHHPDIEKEPDTVAILCAKCHAKEHPRRVAKECPGCGESFVPQRRRTVTCGAKACLSAVGRVNARKRWPATVRA